MSGRRNPVVLVGERPRTGFTMVGDELIRDGGHRDALGPDGYLILSYLLSCASAPREDQRHWETSVRAMADKFGMGRDRVRAALDRAGKDGRLVVREYLLDGRLAPNRCAYVVCAGGRRFTEEELLHWSRPAELKSRRRGGAP